MSDQHRILAVRVVLGLAMTALGATMLAGCPAGTHPPLQPRAAHSAVYTNP